jgi:hypothetical protein
MNLFTDTIEESIHKLPEFQEHHESPYFVCYEVFAIKATYNPETDSWNFATKRKPNAFQSYWAERRSFGDLFLDEVSGICDTLDFVAKLEKNVDYYFLVPLRKKNRVLLTQEEEETMKPTVFLGGAVYHPPATSGAEMDYCTIFDTEADRKHFAGPWQFLPLVEPEAYRAEDYPHSVGVAYCNIRAGACPEKPSANKAVRLIRFLPPKYLELRELRDNVPDIFARYAELWRDRSPKLRLFRAHYAQFIHPFDAAINELYQLYQTRYVQNERAETTTLFHAILKRIRAVQQRKKWESISKNNIYSVVFQNFHTKLYKIHSAAQARIALN